MKILTPAKINPLLYILSKREDGFHELYMHMLPVSLFDTLSFSKNNKKGSVFSINLMEGKQLSCFHFSQLFLKYGQTFFKAVWGIAKITYGFIQ